MAYRRHRHSGGRWGRIAHKKARKVYRRAIHMPKRVLAKKFANTVGQIVYKSHHRRPSHGGRFRRHRRFRRY